MQSQKRDSKSFDIGTSYRSQGEDVDDTTDDSIHAMSHHDIDKSKNKIATEMNDNGVDQVAGDATNKRPEQTNEVRESFVI